MHLEFSEKREALKELDSLSHFRAQTQIEDELILSFVEKLTKLDLDDNLPLNYAKYQGAIQALKKLQGTRKTIIADTSRR